MATASWHWRSTTKDNWTLSHPASTFPRTLARWHERLQNVKFTSYNKISRPDNQYDLNRAVNQDLS
jgi:hypothetical protein